MALRYRGAGLTTAQLAELGKVLIDASDTTADFLSAKLLVTSNLTKTIQNVAGDENILLDVSLSGIETTLDGRYVLLAPSGKNQTILPTTDNIPLTIEGFAGGLSDVLNIFDAASPQKLRWRVDSAGSLIGVLSPTSSPRLRFIEPGLITNTALWRDANFVRIGDAVTDSPLFSVKVQVINWLFDEGILGINDIYDSTGISEWLQLNAVTSNVLLGINGAGSVILQATALKVEPGAASPPGTLSQIFLMGNEVGALERRFRENAGALELTDSTPTVLRSLITRAGANVALPANANLAFITFATNEPDTNYEISVIAAYNTTVSYSAKAVTGFTILFGTAAPAGGSTFDWHIERIPRT